MSKSTWIKLYYLEDNEISVVNYDTIFIYTVPINEEEKKE